MNVYPEAPFSNVAGNPLTTRDSHPGHQVRHIMYENTP
jgi:hypothetical protein